MHGPSLICATVPALAQGRFSGLSRPLQLQKVSRLYKKMCERSQRLFVKLVDDMVGLSADCIIEPLRPSHFGAIGSRSASYS